ncbi:MAG TPA: hypothetical protein VG244_14955, partial [Acidimicrobiales bacterium]|nr:hypothetical protein [Acidimicrobiales bacterium]
MVPGDLDRSAPPSAGGPEDVSHWVKWHGGYEDPASNLSRRLHTVQTMLRRVLDEVPSDHSGP